MPSNLGRKPDAERHFALAVEAFEHRNSNQGAADILRVWAQDNLRQAIAACKVTPPDMGEYFRWTDKATDCLATANKITAAAPPKEEE